MQELLKYINFATSDVNLSNDDKDFILNQIINDIAIETRLFKKRCAVLLLKPVNNFDFELLTKFVIQKEINDIGSIEWNNEDRILEYDISSELELYNDVTVIEVSDITTKCNEPVNLIFQKKNYLQYTTGDCLPVGSYLKWFASIIPKPDDIDKKLIPLMSQALIAGARYYSHFNYNMPEDANSANMLRYDYKNAINTIDKKISDDYEIVRISKRRFEGLI